MTDITQQHMDSAYDKYRTVDWDKRYEAEGLTGKEIAATLLGNFNYQVENGGLVQWWDNRYAFEKGPNGTSTHVALAALVTSFRDIDPEVADTILDALKFVDLIPEKEAAGRAHAERYSYGNSDDEDDDDFYVPQSPLEDYLESEDVTNRYYELGEERRFAFMDQIVGAYPENGNPFEATFDFKAERPVPKAPDDVKYPNVHVRLQGEDGNAEAIIARTRRAMERARVSRDQIEAYTEQARSGDYDNVLSTTMKWVYTDPPEPVASFKM